MRIALTLIFSIFMLMLLLFLIYHNYRIPKLVESIPIIIGVILSIALSILSTNENVSGYFYTKFFSGNKGAYSCNFPLNPCLNKIFIYHTNLSARNDIEFDLNNDKNESTEFVAFAFLSFIFNNYAGNWSNSRKTNDVVEIKPSDLSEEIKQSKFYKGFEFSSNLRKITLPKNSKILIEKIDFVTYRLKIFKNYLFFKDYEISIEIQQNSNYPGLDELGPYFSQTELGSNKFELDEDLTYKYRTHTHSVSYNATFSRIRPWSKEVICYKEWANQLLNRIEYHFNWEKNSSKFKDYMQTTASEIIIQQNKSKYRSLPGN